jgi:hypothetical protein
MTISEIDDIIPFFSHLKPERPPEARWRPPRQTTTTTYHCSPQLHLRVQIRVKIAGMPRKSPTAQILSSILRGIHKVIIEFFI